MPKTMFFNGIEYTAGDFVDLFKGLTNNGIRAADDMKVTASTPNALTVDIGPGKMFVNGYFVIFETTTKVPISANTSGYNRKDIVCVKVDTNTQKTSIVAIEGVPNSNPQIPNLPNVDGENYVILAVINVGNNVSVITNSNIEDKRLITKIWDDYNVVWEKVNNYGYIKFPNGLTMQWGILDVTLNNYTSDSYITFPIKFPNNMLSVHSTISGKSPGFAQEVFTTIYNANSSGFRMIIKDKQHEAPKIWASWFAIGY